jgi:tetratricopeptide (TPR) repeat protein
LGRYDEEIKSYNQAISLNPNHHAALYNLGNCMGSLGRYEEAIEAYSKAINIKPDKYQAIKLGACDFLKIKIRHACQG